MNEEVACLLLTEFLQRVGPENIAHQTVSGGFLKAIDSFDILKGVQLWAETAVDTEELLVHDRRQRQRAERFDAGLVDLFAVFMLAFEFKGEIIRKMSALVVATQQPQCVGIPDLQRPEI